MRAEETVMTHPASASPSSALAPSPVPPDTAPPSPLADFWRHFRANRGALAGLVVFSLVVLAALLAGVSAPHSPVEQYRDALLTPPAWAEGGSTRFLLGTDDIGRDMLSRMLHGARLSLMIGLVAVLLSAIS